MPSFTSASPVCGLPAVLLVKVLQYVPLYERVARCATVSRCFAFHSLHSTAFACDLLLPASNPWAKMDVRQAVALLSRGPVFTLLTQQLRRDNFVYCPASGYILSFTHRLSRASSPAACSTSASPLRCLFLTGAAVQLFAQSILKWGNQATAGAFSNVQYVSLAWDTCAHRPVLPQPVIDLVKSMPSLSALHLGYFSLNSNQLTALLCLPLRRLDLSTCHCNQNINTRNVQLSSRLNTLLLPSFAAWGNSTRQHRLRKPHTFYAPTRRVVDAITNQTASILRRLRITGAFTHQALSEVGTLAGLVSLDLTLHGMTEWTLLSALVGREEDGQHYARLRRLRHFRLDGDMTRESAAAMAPRCDEFTQTLRTFLITYATQLETVSMLVAPVTDSVLFDRRLLPEMPNLRRLEMRGLDTEEKGDIAKTHNQFLVHAASQLPALHTLVLRDVEMADKAVMGLMTATRQLQHVTLERCARITAATLLALATHCPSLVTVYLLNCDRVALDLAAFRTAQANYPTLYLPATVDLHCRPPRLNRGCSVLPETVFSRLHTFVVQHGPQHNSVVDEAGLATLAALFAHSPLQFLCLWLNERNRADWKLCQRMPFSSLPQLRSYVVNNGHCAHRLLTTHTQSRVLDGCEGRLAAMQSAVFCDDGRYGGRLMDAAAVESSSQHWRFFDRVFKSAEARVDFWTAVDDKMRQAREEPVRPQE